MSENQKPLRFVPPTQEAASKPLIVGRKLRYAKMKAARWSNSMRETLKSLRFVETIKKAALRLAAHSRGNNMLRLYQESKTPQGTTPP